MEGTFHNHGEKHDGWVFIDPNQVSKFVSIRDVDASHVEALMESIRNSGYDTAHPVTGRFREGVLEILDGAHRCMAIVRGMEKGVFPPGVTIPMREESIVADTNSSTAVVLDRVRATTSNDIAGLQRRMMFVEYLMIAVDLRDEYWVQNGKDKYAHISSVRMADVLGLIKSCDPSGQIASSLSGKPQYSSCMSILAVLRPYHRAEDSSSIDLRLWQMFCHAWGLNAEMGDSPRMVEFPKQVGVTSSRAVEMFGKTPRGELSSPLNRELLSSRYFLDGATSDMQDSLQASQKRFRRLMVMMCQCILAIRSKEMGSAPSRRARATSGAIGGGGMVGIATSSAQANQLGFVVDRVLAAWDTGARVLGYEDVESMCWPFMVFDPASLCFRSLPNRSDGCAVEEHRKNLTIVPKTVDSENGFCADLPVAVDARLRSLTSAFLLSIRQCVTEVNVFAERGQLMQRLRALLFDTPDKFGLNSFMRAKLNTSHALDGQRRLKAWLLRTREQRKLPLTMDELHSLEDTPEPGILEGAPAQMEISAAVPNNGSEDIEEDSLEPQRKKARLERGGGEDDNAAVASETATREGAAEDDAMEVDTVSPTEAPLVDVGKESKPEYVTKLEAVMGRYIHTVNCDATDVAKEVEDKISFLEDGVLEDSVQLVLTDPPFNTRREGGRENSEYDILEPEELASVACEIVRVLRPGGHALIYSSVRQLVAWMDAIRNAEPGKMIVDSVPVVLSRRPHSFTSNPSTKTCTLHNMHDFVIHAYKRGKGMAAYDMVDYRLHNPDISRHPGFTNAIDNVPRLSAGEAQYDGQNNRLRHEQKALTTLRELLERFSKQNDIVMDFFSGTYSTAIACMTLRDGTYRRFIGCEKEKRCHDASQEWILHAFVSEVKAGRYGGILQREVESILGDESVPVTGKAPRLRQKHISDAPEGLPAVTALPNHLLVFVASMKKDGSMLHRLSGVPMDQWPAEDMHSFWSIDPDAILAADAAFYGVYVSQSEVRGGGFGVFAAKKLKKGTVIGWYNGTIFYAKIRDSEPQRSVMYGPEGFGCTGERFQDYNMELETTYIGRGAPVRKVWLVPAVYNCTSYLNDCRVIDGTEKATEVSRTQSAEFRQGDAIDKPDFASNIKNPHAVKVVLTRDVEADEEIFADYGRKYWPAN